MTKKLGLDQIPPANEATAQALFACTRGQATGAQQAEAMRYIMGDLGMLGAFESASLSERSAGFASGRRFVGTVIAQLARVPLFVAQKDEEE